jgi:alpha-L-rhamnosidase
MPGDGLLHCECVDIPTGEFWLKSPRYDKPTDIQDAVSGSRVYGKQIAMAEAFTEIEIDWTEHPYSLKALGDYWFTEGINKFMLMVWTHQPYPERALGITLGGSIGTFFSGTQTWWKPGRAWLHYLRRCHALLQSGLSVADAAYFTGENVPRRAFLPSQIQPAMPIGYAYKSINRDALLRVAQVRDGRLVLDSGLSYEVLVLPGDRLLTPEVINKIRDLVAAGATVVGPPPHRSPSLEHYPTADVNVGQVASALWGKADGSQITENRFGKGRIIWGESMETVFSKLQVAPDVLVSFSEGNGTGRPVPATEVRWIHRRGQEYDLYFLSNQTQESMAVEASFRNVERIPEFWHPDSGAIEDAAIWREEEGRTVLPLRLDPAGSVFVVFQRSAADMDPVIEVLEERIKSKNDVAIRLRRYGAGALEAWVSDACERTLRTRSGRSLKISTQDVPKPIDLEGPWTVQFPDRKGVLLSFKFPQLRSWTHHTDPDIKFFSGTATYDKMFALSPKLLRGNSRFFLELGEIANLARVRMNGQDPGVLWKPPIWAGDYKGDEDWSEPSGNRSHQHLEEPSDRRCGKATVRTMDLVAELQRAVKWRHGAIAGRPTWTSSNHYSSQTEAGLTQQL